MQQQLAKLVERHGTLGQVGSDLGALDGQQGRRAVANRNARSMSAGECNWVAVFIGLLLIGEGRHATMADGLEMNAP